MSDTILREIANKQYAERLDELRQEPQKRSAEEFYVLLKPEEVEHAAEEYFAQRAYLLEVIRNGSILLPLLVTWISLGLAAMAYIQTYTLTNDSFLKQWADGFPKAHLWIAVPSFVGVAITDAVIIFTLLVITIIVQVIENNAHRKAVALRQWLEQELYQLASQSLVKSLGVGDDQKQPAWAVEVHTAILRLNTALQGVEILVASSQSFVKDLVDTSQTALQNIVSVSQEKFEGTAREFHGVIGDQREAISTFTSGIKEVRRAADKLETIYVEGEHVYKELNLTLPKIDKSFQTMATKQTTAATALETVSTHTQQSTQAVTDIASQFTQTALVTSTRQAAEQMQASAEIMQTIAEQMNETVRDQFLLQKRLEMQIKEWQAAPNKLERPIIKLSRFFTRKLS